jgi:hypothetical protein
MTIGMDIVIILWVFFSQVTESSLMDYREVLDIALRGFIVISAKDIASSWS